MVIKKQIQNYRKLKSECTETEATSRVLVTGFTPVQHFRPNADVSLSMTCPPQWSRFTAVIAQLPQCTY